MTMKQSMSAPLPNCEAANPPARPVMPKRSPSRHDQPEIPLSGRWVRRQWERYKVTAKTSNKEEKINLGTLAGRLRKARPSITPGTAPATAQRNTFISTRIPRLRMNKAAMFMPTA